MEKGEIAPYRKLPPGMTNVHLLLLKLGPNQV